MAALTLTQILEIAATRTLTKAERTRKSCLLRADQRREESKQRYHKDIEASRERQRAKRRADPERQAAYAAKGRIKRLAKDPDFEREAARRWREEHPDYWVEFFGKDKEGNAERSRKYRAEHPGFALKHARKRRVRKLAVGGEHTQAQIETLFIVQNCRCANPFCRTLLTKKTRQLDHIKPLHPRPEEPQGNDDIENLQWLCKSCNTSKFNYTEDFWLARQLRKWLKSARFLPETSTQPAPP